MPFRRNFLKHLLEDEGKHERMLLSMLHSQRYDVSMTVENSAELRIDESHDTRDLNGAIVSLFQSSAGTMGYDWQPRSRERGASATPGLCHAGPAAIRVIGITVLQEPATQ